MNKSEWLLSAFSEDYFFKELVFNDLCYTPENSTEIELADLIINLDDYIIAIQLKERNTIDQTFDEVRENTWLEKKCKVAKKQVKDTIQLISSGNISAFRNKRGQTISLRADAEIIPLVVFHNSSIDTYPHLLRKHSEDGVDINCMSFADYAEMCRVLISPIEIVRYLEYRKQMYTENGDVGIMILDGVDNEFIIAKPTRGESLTYIFLAETYGFHKATSCIDKMQLFRSFLHRFPNHIISDASNNESYKVLLFLAHMNRIEIYEFWNMLDDTKKKSQAGELGIRHLLRPSTQEYAVLFVAGEILPMNTLLPIVKEKAPKVKRVLEVSIHWIDKQQFAIDFVYWIDDWTE